MKTLKDIENGNIEVCVEVEEGYTYTVSLATAKNLESWMDREKKNYFDGHPLIIVKKLTKEIIEETLQACAKKNDGYLLKLSHFAGAINTTVFNKLKAKQILDRLALDLDELDNS